MHRWQMWAHLHLLGCPGSAGLVVCVDINLTSKTSSDWTTTTLIRLAA
jgi:hypothetical protein